MADEFDKSELESKILELGKLVIFKYRDQKLTGKQQRTYNAFGWYADSIGEALWESNQLLTVILDEMSSQNRALLEKTEQAMAEIEDYKHTVEVLTENVRNLNNDRQAFIERAESAERRLDELDKWIKGCIDEHNARFDSHDMRLDENNARFDEHDRRLDENNKRFDGYDKRLDENNTRFDEHDRRLDENNRRFDGYDKRLDENNTRFDEHDRRLDENNKRFDEHDRRLDENNARFDIHDMRLDELAGTVAGITAAGANSFSQSGEDMISEYVLKFLKRNTAKLRYLDLGANHSKELSNTYKFYKSGGRGVLVEANPELIPELLKDRQGDVILNRLIVPKKDRGERKRDFYVLTGDGLSTLDYDSALEACKVNPDIKIKQKYSVETVSVEEILAEYFKDGLDILSIDLEGLEYMILAEIDFSSYRPKIVILESIEYRPYLVMEKSLGENIRGLLEENDYKEYAFTGINSIFIDMKFAEKINREIKENLKRKG